jgi:ubiquinone/menaquinone biosynthesis C-methylase UbiE
MSSEMDKESWNKFAKQYDKMTLLWPGYFASVDRILELASPSPDMVALDVGCGTGALALKLAPRCKRVIGVDISSKMLEIARGKAENLGIKKC